MALAKIIVPLAAGADPTTALELARRAAQLTSGRIEAMCVGPDALLMLKAAVGPDVHLWTANMMPGLSAAAAKQRATSRACFDDWMAKRGLSAQPELDHEGWRPGVKWTDHDGDMELLVSQLARFGELIVLDGASLRGPDVVAGFSVLEAALFDAKRPVLVAPGNGEPGLDRGALIAWDGSGEALHALSAALPILNRGARTTLLTLGAPQAHDPVGEAALLDWLACYGVLPERRFAKAPAGNAGRELLNQAAQCEADLIVMGAYTHSRLRESVFGGTTRFVLEHSEIPVLLAH